jgi:hypothetical protein
MGKQSTLLKETKDKNFVLNVYLLYNIKGKLQNCSVPEVDIQEQGIHCHFQVQTVSSLQSNGLLWLQH